MKRTTLIQIIQQLVAVLALTLVAAHAFGDEVSQSLESIGSKRSSHDRAYRFDSRARVGIVHGRAIDRNWRVELGANYGPSAFGDAYLNTQTLGGRVDLHVNPAFSLGVLYAKAFNQLSNEGEARMQQARFDAATYGNRPRIAYPEDQVMGVINWYMTYGKLNFFDWRTFQFDIYSLAGFGQINVTTNSNGQESAQTTGVWTGGAGIGFWLAQHLTSRFEIRYQSYSDKAYGGARDINQIIGTFGLGVLL